MTTSVKPLGQGLALRQRGDAYDVILGNVVLLSSAALETERKLGLLVKDLDLPARKRILIGGLGFGATLRGVLDSVGEDAEVMVAEKLAPIVDLVRGELSHLSGDALRDPRATLLSGDVFDILGEQRDLDAILLDVDNGPDWASFRSNARLYAPEGLARAKAALAGGGALGVWSGYAKDAFIGRLRTAGFEPSVVPLTERGSVRARVYVGKKRGTSPAHA